MTEKQWPIYLEIQISLNYNQANQLLLIMKLGNDIKLHVKNYLIKIIDASNFSIK